MTGGCRMQRFVVFTPSCKNLTPVTTAYRISAQPLIPSSGIWGSRNFAISVCLHLLCVQLYFLVCDRLGAIAFSCLSASLLFSSCFFMELSPSFWLPSSSYHLIILLSPYITLAYCSSPSWLSPLLSVSSFTPLSLCRHLCHLFLLVRPALLSNVTPYLSTCCVDPLLSTPSNNSLHPALLFCHYGYLF